MKKLSVVVSVYNEELSLPYFYRETKKVLDGISWEYELVFVNDGSQDGSEKILRGLAENPRVKVIQFSRNFGHEAAMIAGIDYASGDGVICMDADLQHPPAYIPAIVDKFEEGFEVISMIRTKNADAGIVKRVTSRAFYAVLNLISPVKFENNASDFFAVSKNVCEVLKQDYREKIRYLRGYVQSVGFQRTTIAFEADKRFAGESKYNLGRLLKFSLNALFSFSDLPLKLGIYSGLFMAFLGVVLMIYTLVNKFVFYVPSGYSTIVVFLCFMFAILFVIIGIIGEYISIIFTEVKGRPIYIVREVMNGEKEGGQINESNAPQKS